MRFEGVNFNDFTFEGIYETPYAEKFQPITSRFLTKHFSQKLNSYNVYKFITKEFFQLPYESFEVLPDEEARPDLVAYRHYNDPDFYWVVLLFNSLASPRDLIPGRIIKLPYLSSLYSYLMRRLTKS